MKKSDAFFEKRGMEYDSKTGFATVVDFLKFARFYIERDKIIKTNDKLFYNYKNNFYSSVTIEDIKDRVYRNVQRQVICTNIMKAETQLGYYVKRETPIVKKMNEKKHILNFNNCLYNLKTLEQMEHTPNVFNTIRIPFDFDENADCPLFMEFLYEIFEGDEERVRAVQEWYGYCLTPDVLAQKVLMLYGQGNDGKSVTLNILRYIIGSDNISNISLNDLNNPFSRMYLKDKTANIAAENEFTGKAFTTQYFKMISGGDAFTGEQKFGDTISIEPTVKLLFAMNSLPKAHDFSYGFKRRLFIVPFNLMLTENEIDRKLEGKLKKEASGILNWALEGLCRLRENEFKFSRCKASERAIHEYLGDISPVYGFVSDCIKHAADKSINNSELRDKYKDWLKDEEGEIVYNPNTFMGDFKKALGARRIPFKERKSNGARSISGIAFKG